MAGAVEEPAQRHRPHPRPTRVEGRTVRGDPLAWHAFGAISVLPALAMLTAFLGVAAYEWSRAATALLLVVSSALIAVDAWRRPPGYSPRSSRRV